MLYAYKLHTANIYCATRNTFHSIRCSKIESCCIGNVIFCWLFDVNQLCETKRKIHEKNFHWLFETYHKIPVYDGWSDSPSPFDKGVHIQFQHMENVIVLEQQYYLNSGVRKLLSFFFCVGCTKTWITKKKTWIFARENKNIFDVLNYYHPKWNSEWWTVNGTHLIIQHFFLLFLNWSILLRVRFAVLKSNHIKCITMTNIIVDSFMNIHIHMAL